MFNTGLFLVEVQKRPCLWNLKDSSHNDRQAKLRAWEEIVEVFNTCDTYFNQNITVDVLQRKWKYLRDYYLREKKRTSKAGTEPGAKNSLGRKRHSPLLEMLQFLNVNQGTDTVEINKERNETEEHFYSEANEEDESGHEISNSSSSKILRIDVLQSNPLADNNEESTDKQFLNSLLPIIKNLSIRERLKFRAQLKNLTSQDCPSTDEEEKRKTLEPRKRKKIILKTEENIEVNRETRSAEVLPRRDEFSIYGEYVANKLRNIRNKHARHTAEFKINGILYKAEIGEYDDVPKDVKATRSNSSKESSNVRIIESVMYDEDDSNDTTEDVLKTEVSD